MRVVIYRALGKERKIWTLLFENESVARRAISAGEDAPKRGGPVSARVTIPCSITFLRPTQARRKRSTKKPFPEQLRIDNSPRFLNAKLLQIEGFVKMKLKYSFAWSL